MKAQELIGKKALREKPIEREIFTGSFLSMSGPSVSTQKDYSYCTEPVKILAATDCHIIIEEEVESIFSCSEDRQKTKQVILDERFCDDNWTSYDELMDKVAAE